MTRYSIIYFIQQVSVEDKSSRSHSVSIVPSNLYVTKGGYTPYIDNATLFTSDTKAMESIPATDETLYIIQHVYKNG